MEEEEEKSQKVGKKCHLGTCRPAVSVPVPPSAVHIDVESAWPEHWIFEWLTQSHLGQLHLSSIQSKEGVYSVNRPERE